MALAFLVSIDLALNELQNARIQRLATAPTPAQARIYFDTVLGQIGVYNGSAWNYLGGGGDASTLNGNNAAFYLARGNHTGTQAWSTLTGTPTTLAGYGIADAASASALATHEADTTAIHGITNTANLVLTGDTRLLTDIDKTDLTDAGDSTLHFHSADRNRTNHTGTQLAATISNFDTSVRLNRLDQLALPTASVALNAQKITGLAEPTLDQDAATKNYVDASRQGLDVKASVRVATVGNITLSGTQTIDGVAVIALDRVLVKNQSVGADNGIYVVAAGAWARAVDANSATKLSAGTFTFVEEGAAAADTGWVLSTNDSITLGTTALTFTQFSSAGVITAGVGITRTGNSIAIDTASGYGIRRVATSVGDAAAVAIVVTHNLGTRDVQVQLFQSATPWAWVLCDVEATSTNTVTLRFAVAPALNEYRAVIVG